jgi:hypothetical protein
VRVHPEHAHFARVGPAQADDGVEQHRLPGAGAPDHAQHLAAAHGQVEAVVDAMAAELGDQPPHGDGRTLGGVLRRGSLARAVEQAQMFSSM